MHLESEVARMIDQRLRPDAASPTALHQRAWRQGRQGRVRPLAFRLGGWLVEAGRSLQGWSADEYGPLTAR